MDGTAAATLFSWHLQASEIIGATSSNSRPTIVRERCIASADGSFQVVPDYVVIGPTTSRKEIYTFPSTERPEEAVVAQIREFLELQEGWDGEFASKPDADSIEGASNLVRLLGRSAMALEPTLHADGSVILETDDGSAIHFVGARHISAILPGFAGMLSFDGMSIPPEISEALSA
ncbi:hypothetical protein [Pleomorphomonas carboxyditropha]|uniref:Uncharacterized protein n=1 Tax=Pleomorphomonas carboxyditropha TaxID=2023338 RepID=A0A2G9WSC2_9HYPH|nr:hypothetical protein [Pleomorphomonas carboxyditropha]PIO97545.1 hypothetical protein CJ014_20090 [Pleomorphomonas carboxyditropha]